MNKHIYEDFKIKIDKTWGKKLILSVYYEGDENYEYRFSDNSYVCNGKLETLGKLYEVY